MNLIIAGARYFDGKSILVPHFTGNFRVVTCNEYIPFALLKERYGYDDIEQVFDLKHYLEHEGIKYYYTQPRLFHITKWELISDLSSLRFVEG